MKPLIPAAALTQHIIVLGKTGAGKSSAVRGEFIEPLLSDNQPVCIIDPKGDWWGLKSSADGKKAGYAIVIFGGDHADVPINEHSGEHVAELFATGNRSMIVDLSQFMVGERTRFFMRFASALYRKNRGRKWLVMDECHNLAPQGKVLDPDSGKALHWANKLASEGRGKGITIIGASQRPQKVHKDFITSMETLVAMRVIHNLDRDAIKAWIDGCADKALGKQVLDELANMVRGEAWVWSPEINFGPEKIKFPMFTTYDSFKPQDADAGKLAGWASVNLDDVREQLATVVAEAEANDPARLRKRVAELENQLSKKDFATAFDKGALDGARRDGYSRGYHDGQAPLVHYLRSLEVTLSLEVTGAQKILASVGKEPEREIPKPSVPKTPSFAKTLQPVARATVAREYSDNLPSPTVRKILDVIHRSYPVALSFDAAARRAGVSKQSSAYRKYRKELEQSKEIVMDGDRFQSHPEYAQGGISSGAGIDEWLSKLPPSYGKMLKAIYDNPAIGPEGIANEAGVSQTSSGLGTGLRELQRLELIEKEGTGYRVTEGLR